MKTLLRSFAGGEIAPELHGRVDLNKFQTGLAKCLNFTVLPHGPVSRRPGLRFVNQVKDSARATRLIPFAFSADQTVVLEFGHLYVRFHIEGETVLEASKAIVSIVGNNVEVTAHGYTSGDWVYITNRFYIATVTGPNNFTVTGLRGEAATPAGTTVARVYEVATPYSEADLFDLHYAQNNDVLTIVHPDYAARELSRLAAASWTLTAIDFSPTAQAPGNLAVIPTVATPGNASPQEYVVTAVLYDGVTESLPSDSVATSNNLSVAGNYNTITFDPVDGATRYNVYKRRGGSFGFIGQTTVVPSGPTVNISSISRGSGSQTVTVNTATPHGFTTGDVVLVGDTPSNRSINGSWRVAVVDADTFTYTSGARGTYSATSGTVRIPALSVVDDNVLADTLKTPPDDIIGLNEESASYPSAVTYYEQRRWFAGTANVPQGVWATRNGTETNLTSSTPSQDDDALEFRIASRQQNAIRHLLPLSDMLALTVGAEFRIFADNAPVITPTSLSIKPQGYSGASNVQPALTSVSVLYVQAQGSRVREMSYSGEQNAYGSVDVSIMAPHLFNGYTITDLAYSRAPVPTLWAVRDDGVLLGMTYVPEQQVFAWHQHDTDGAFESVAVVSEGNEDVMYAVVQRTVAGASVRYIERLHSRIFSAQADAFYVDSGLTYDGAPVSSVSGLWHLEGETVQLLVDGATHPPRTVTNGAVTLDASYSTVHVGLRYNSDIITLPLAFETRTVPAMGQGTTRNINGIAARITQSSLLKAGPDFDRLTEYPARAVTDLYGNPPALRTEEARFDIDPSWNSEGAVCVRQDQPLPLTVLSMALDFATGG